MDTPLDALVIGAGQAGLAAGYHLQRAGLHFAILDAAAQPGGSWPHHYASLPAGAAYGRRRRALSDARRGRAAPSPTPS